MRTLGITSTAALLWACVGDPLVWFTAGVVTAAIPCWIRWRARATWRELPALFVAALRTMAEAPREIEREVLDKLARRRAETFLLGQGAADGQQCSAAPIFGGK